MTPQVSKADSAPPRGPAARPVFIGGTGRSGTTVVARLLGRHSELHSIPVETRFIVRHGGLCDLVEGETTFTRFKRRLLRRWYHREMSAGVRGLHRVMDRQTIDASLDQLERDAADDLVAACAAFVHRLFDPLATEHGAHTWLEMTPDNVIAGTRLFRLFPDLRLVNCVRDGRDVACSVTSQSWGPDDADDALDWWADRIRRGSDAVAALPPDRVLQVRLEDLVAGDREREYARLLDFLGLDEDPAMRAYFETAVSADRAHIGRWKEQIPDDRRAAFDAHYRALVAGLGPGATLLSH